MDFTQTPLPGVLLLNPRRFDDERGFFSECYNKSQLAALGIDTDFVQDNLSFSKPRLTVRGLHFQKEPWAQAKLLTVVSGAVLDVLVDLRRSSPSFGQHFSIRLSATEGTQVFIPIGFAHGFLTLEPGTLLTYKVSNYYSPEHDTGIRFDDARLNIDWGVDRFSMVISEKDQNLPAFNPSADYFS